MRERYGRQPIVNPDGTPTAYFLSLDDRRSTALDPLLTPDTGWTAATGTPNKGAYATYAGQTMSVGYVQAEQQAQDDALKSASQRILAIEQVLRTAGLLDG